MYYPRGHPKQTRQSTMGRSDSLRVQVLNNRIPTHNPYYNYYSQNPSSQLLGTWTLWDCQLLKFQAISIDVVIPSKWLHAGAILEGYG